MRSIPEIVKGKISHLVTRSLERNLVVKWGVAVFMRKSTELFKSLYYFPVEINVNVVSRKQNNLKH